MTDASMAAARRGTTSLATCLALLAVPLLLVVAGLSVLETKDQLPGLSGDFQATHSTGWACAAVSALVVGAFARGLSRLGPHWKLPRSQLVFLVLGAWIGGFMLLVIGMCGALNRAMGEVVHEPARVQSKFQAGGKGCHRVVEVAGTTVPSGTRLCVDATRWDSLQEGDTLPLARVASGLGEQIGLAPAGPAASAGTAR